MKPLEDELRNALKRREPPPGFAGRVMARVEQLAEERARTTAEAPRRWTPWTFSSWFGRKLSVSFGAMAALAAVLLLTIGVAVWQQHRMGQERREGEAARAQLMEALRVTSSKLNHVRTKVRSVTDDGASDRAPSRRRTSAAPQFEGPHSAALPAA